MNEIRDEETVAEESSSHVENGSSMTTLPDHIIFFPVKALSDTNGEPVADDDHVHLEAEVGEDESLLFLPVAGKGHDGMGKGAPGFAKQVSMQVYSVGAGPNTPNPDCTQHADGLRALQAWIDTGANGNFKGRNQRLWMRRNRVPGEVFPTPQCPCDFHEYKFAAKVRTTSSGATGNEVDPHVRFHRDV